MQFSKDLLLEIHQQIKPFINKTPVLRFDLVDELCECNVFFKCENFQKTGSFKIRAASNAIKSMPSKYKENGVITHSSGNFAQGLACASSLQDINAFIVMPDNAFEPDMRGVWSWGGTLPINSAPANVAKTAIKIRLINCSIISIYSWSKFKT